MKVSFLSAALTLASLCTCATADVTLGPFPDFVDVGDTYTLSWTATENYTYTLWLVVETAGEGGYGWSKAQGLASSLEFDHLEGSYTWTVPANLSSHSTYSLWLDGFAIPFDGSSYASMTDWFRVSFSNNTITTPEPTSSTSAPISSPTAITTPSASSAVPTSSSTSGASSGEPTETHTHHNGLSAGAIAGIVIGILVAIAFIVAAVLFGKWRNKRTAQQKREAAARDNRLAPVMQAGAGSFEMDGRDPQANKDFNV